MKNLLFKAIDINKSELFINILCFSVSDELSEVFIKVSSYKINGFIASKTCYMKTQEILYLIDLIEKNNDIEFSFISICQSAYFRIYSRCMMDFRLRFNESMSDWLCNLEGIKLKLLEIHIDGSSHTFLDKTETLPE